MTFRSFISFTALSLSLALSAQVPTEQDCLGAIAVCEDVYVQTQAYSGEGNFTGEIALGVGCNFSETNSVWYTFTIQSDGLFSFTLTPVANADDYDWALFNLTNADCGAIATDPSLEVSCNSYGDFGSNGPTGISSANGGTGNSNGPGNTNGPPFNADLPVTAGEVYALLVMDWSGTPTGYTLDFSNTTAGIYDDQGPQIASAELNCDNTIDVVFDENVVCGSLDDVDWELVDEDGQSFIADSYTSSCTGPDEIVAGISLVFTQDIVPAGSSAAFTLNIINDLGNVLDPCGNEVAFEDLDFDFQMDPIEVIPQVIDADCDAANGQVDVATILNGTAPFTYDLNGSSQATPIFNGLASGDYTLTVTDSEFCTEVLELTIEEPSPPVISSIETTPVLCGSGCTGSIVIEAGTVLSYSIDGGLSSSVDNVFNGVCEGEYEILVNSGNNCEASTVVNVGSTSPLDVALEIDPIRASIYDPSFLFQNLTEGPGTAEWFIGSLGETDQVIGDSLVYVFSDPRPGFYDVMLQVTDTAGCESSLSTQVELFTEFSAFIPNSFSPNGDGVNDTFRPVLEGFEEDKYLLSIYDRWGSLVFQSDDPEQPWLGQVDEGGYYPTSQVFHFTLSVAPISTSGNEVMHGTVTLLR